MPRDHSPRPIIHSIIHCAISYHMYTVGNTCTINRINTFKVVCRPSEESDQHIANGTLAFAAHVKKLKS